MANKDFFKNRSPAEIRELDFTGEARNNLFARITNLDSDEHLVIGKDLLSKPVMQAKKHGNEVIIPQAKSQRELMSQRITPVQMREKEFNELQEKHQKTGRTPVYSGLIFRPPRGSVDTTLSKITLVGSIEGLRVFDYSHQIPGTRITYKLWDGARAVETEGAKVDGNVPSREEGKQRYDLVSLNNIALIDNDRKYVIAQTLSSDHICKDKRYNQQLRFPIGNEKSKGAIKYLCPHDIALYLEIIDREHNDNKNLVPLMASQIPLPTEDTVEFYKKLLNNVLIKDTYKSGKSIGKEYTRGLNQSEQEALLWGSVMKRGHDATFYATKDLKEVNWDIAA